MDFQQQQLSVDAVCGIQRENLADYFQLGCLRNDLVECLFRSREYYGDPGKFRIIGRRYRQGVDIETSSSKEADDSRQNVGLVIYQNADNFFLSGCPLILPPIL